MRRYAVHVDRPSFRGFKSAVVVEAASCQDARRQVEAKYGSGSVIRVLDMPGQGR